LKPEQWGHRWFKRSAGKKKSVARDNDDNNDNDYNNNDDDDDDDNDKFRKYVSTITRKPGNHEDKELRKTAILCTAHILRKVLM
jgi:hypothetical protein